jgi:hypothetical protein
MYIDSETILRPGVIPDAEPMRELIVVASAGAGLRAAGAK